jgi:uncharacterized tellurite resistance protein B-like protein
MFLIFGLRGRYKTVAEGGFYCPHEGGDRQYRRQEARRWFTLFFIPVIPLDVLGEFVECASCGRTYDPKVLTLPTAAQMMDNLANAMRHAVVSIINADGIVDRAEKRVALEVMEEFSDTLYMESDLDRDLERLKPHGLADEMTSVAGMLNESGKERLLEACLKIAAADGSIDDSELEEVTRAGAALGMSPAHIKGVIAHTQSALFDE